MCSSLLSSYVPLFLHLGQAGLGLSITESKPGPSIKRAEIINLSPARALKHKAKPGQGWVRAGLRLAWSMSTRRSNTVQTTLFFFVCVCVWKLYALYLKGFVSPNVKIFVTGSQYQFSYIRQLHIG